MSVFAAKRFEQAVITAAADDGLFCGRLLERLEDEAGVIFEIAGKTRREGEFGDVEAARGHEAEPRVEAIERGIQIDARRAGELAQPGRGLVGVRFDGEKFLQDRALLGREFLAGFQRRLFKKTLGDLCRRAAADAGNTGDREQIFDECAGARLVRALERGEHAGMVGRRLAAGWARMASRVLSLRMAAQNPPLPSRREIKRGDEIADQAIVAKAYIEIALAKRGDGIERNAENLGISGFPVGMAEILDPRLQELARPVGAIAEHGAAIAVGRGAPGRLRGEIMLADRDRIFRPQAIFGAGEIARQIETAADILARIEEQRRPLQDRRLVAWIAGGFEVRDKGRGRGALGGCGILVGAHGHLSNLRFSLAIARRRRDPFRRAR